MKEFVDFYELLGVNPHATTPQIDRAYRAKMREAHPDRHDGANEARLRTERLIEARKVLKDPVARARYDVERLKHRSWQRQWQRVRARRAPTPSLVTHSPPVTRPTAAPPPPDGGLGTIVGFGLSALYLILSANSYDDQIGRYRDGHGRFRKGRFS